MMAGRLDRRITLQRKTVTQDEYGQEIETWTDLATVWAEKRDMKGSERWQAQQKVAEVETTWRIRWRDGITPLDRLLDGDQVYDVTGVAEIGRREGLEITASARAE